MNERIKELLDWAKDHARIYVIECELANIPVVQEEYDQRFQEMFAELIVRECMSFQDEAGIYSKFDMADAIAQHFGVDK